MYFLFSTFSPWNVISHCFPRQLIAKEGRSVKIWHQVILVRSAYTGSFQLGINFICATMSPRPRHSGESKLDLKKKATLKSKELPKSKLKHSKAMDKLITNSESKSASGPKKSLKTKSEPTTAESSKTKPKSRASQTTSTPASKSKEIKTSASSGSSATSAFRAYRPATISRTSTGSIKSTTKSKPVSAKSTTTKSKSTTSKISKSSIKTAAEAKTASSKKTSKSKEVTKVNASKITPTLKTPLKKYKLKKGYSSSSQEVDMNGPTALLVKELINSDGVVIFSKSYCPYCKMAKEVFDNLKQKYTAIELDNRDDGDAIQSVLGEMTGAKTVPRVFVKGECVGGGSDVKQLHDSGKLMQKLETI